MHHKKCANKDNKVTNKTNVEKNYKSKMQAG